jgi:orotidine-5'-phosphate decarboxylase
LYKIDHRIIVAIDCSSKEKATQLITDGTFPDSIVKVGLEIFTFAGPEIIKYIKVDLKRRVFLDLKFNDTAQTMARAANNVTQLGVDAFSVHASAGLKAVQAAVANKRTSKVLGVTVPTSLSDEECIAIFGKPALEQVLLFTEILSEAQVDGVICSPHEARHIRQIKKFNHLSIVTPGIRPVWASANGQARYTTPTNAILWGADMLVIGKPITEPPDSLNRQSMQAYEMISREIRESAIVSNFC